MSDQRERLLRERGFVYGSIEDFLELTPEERQLVELRLMLGDMIREKRLSANVTQVELAKMIGSSQSRISKTENGDPSVAMDLQIKVILKLGTSLVELAKALETRAKELPLAYVSQR